MLPRMLARLATSSVLVLTLACSSPGCSGGTASTGLPAALRTRGETEEIRPFTDFAVPGLALYLASGAVPDHGWSYVIGVAEDGSLVEGAALMARFGAMTPDLFAARVISVLLREHGASPVLPGGEPSQRVSEQAARIVHAPRIADGSLVFFFLEGEMSPTLNEIRVDARTFALTRRSADEVLLAAGETVLTGQAACQPFARCGCYDGCRRFMTIRVPPDGATRFRLEGESEAVLFEAGAPCTGERCARVCRADTESAYCDPALVRIAEECGEACPASEAPYHCETLSTGCRVVPHTIRSRTGG